MRTELQRIINLKNFFKVVNSHNDYITYNYSTPSKILLHNIYKSWLQSICLKSSKHFPVFVDKTVENIKKQKVPFGLIVPHSIDEYDGDVMHNYSDFAPQNKTELQLKVYVPKQDVMQCFIQWQRHRKYWWSSITTTPSLFTIKEMRQERDVTIVDIVAQFDKRQPVVETVTLDDKHQMDLKTSCISCSTTLEGALFILLMDGLNGNAKDHLSLHRKMAPYKISFALEYEDPEIKETLNELAFLIYSNLESNKISSWLPDFELPIESQIKENLLMGVVYTAVVSQSTLSQGILHLLNSKTMLKEQVHISDINNYATLLFQS